MKPNVIVFRGRLARAQDAEDRAMRGTHSSGKRWFYTGLALGIVITLLVLEGT